MGLNTTGQANTNDYELGRGRLYVAELVNGLPGDAGWRDMGNAPEFNLSVDVETLKHQSSRQGLRFTDKEVITLQELNLSFQLDEVSFQNLALFLSGTTTPASAYTNPAVAGFAQTVFVTSAPDYSVIGGRWYDIQSAAGVRAYDVASANVAVHTDTGGLNTLLVEGTDYDLDEKQGRIFIRAGAGITPTQDVAVTLTADAGAVSPDQVSALTQSNPRVALKFISENPANNDKQKEYVFHQVQLKPEGDFPLIGDEWTTMGYTATAESNVNGETLTVRDHANS